MIWHPGVQLPSGGEKLTPSYWEINDGPFLLFFLPSLSPSSLPSFFHG
jgi:hypothetical protein